jgi:hypothetical protein
MLLYLSEYKLAKHLNDKDISTLAKILLCLFSAMVITLIFIKSFQSSFIGILWLVLFFSFIPLSLKNNKNLLHLTKNLNYLVFPITIKALLLFVIIYFISAVLSIAYITYLMDSYNSSTDSIMNELLFEGQSNQIQNTTNELNPPDSQTLVSLSIFISLAVSIIFIRWRYHKCVKLMDKYNV